MNPDVLCMGCMADTNAADVCPHCAYVNRTPPESSAQLAPRTILNERYLLGKVLGQGGFGITYLAYDLSADRKLAIKEYFPTTISTRAQDRITVTPLSSRNHRDLEYGLKKFDEEGQALFRFRGHANVVQMIELFHANGTAYIVMLYIKGRTFKEHLLANGGKISFTDALRPLTLVMNGLHDLHSVGILHRDVSPDNIYLEDDGGVRILDFGTTRYAMGEQSRSLSVVLKIGYAPEEQYRSRGKQGPWTDIYALGATFYRAIAGRIAPESVDRMQLDDLIPPSQLGSDIPSRSESALLKAMAVRAESRFQSIAEFRDAITPPTFAPASQRPSKNVFLPIFATLLLLAFVSTFSPDWIGLLAVSQLCLFLAMLAFFRFMWGSIQDSHASISAEKAVGLTLIPIFNLYWVFPVLWGFAKDYNRFVDRNFISTPKLNTQLFLYSSMSLAAYWFSSVFGATPFVSVMLVIHAVFLFPMVLKACNGVDALREVDLTTEANRSVVEQYKSMPASSPTTLSLRCTTGEYQGLNLDIGPREIVIGRSATLANLVFSSVEVSGKHVRVWRDPESAGAWVEDLHSTNGTFYKDSRAPRNEWVRISGKQFLSIGDRFRLSEHVAEFEITGS